MKYIAYYKDKDCWHRIYARDAKAKEEKFPSKWVKKTYYSFHAIESIRLTMHLKTSPKGKPFFAYNPGQDDLLEKYGGGESLAHYLFKIAISELKSTTLRILGSDQEIEIKIINSKIEHKINKGEYVIDVFLKFESDSLYQRKWGSILAVEVHHTNSVNAIKLEAIRDKRIPLIEVDVSKHMMYRISEEDSTQNLEQEYIDHIKSKLSKYMNVRLLNDPKSIGQLEYENKKLIDYVRENEKKRQETDVKLHHCINENNKIKIDLDKNTELVDSQNKKLQQLENQIIKQRNMNFFEFLKQKIIG